MLYNPPTGGAANDPYVGKNVAAGIQGSKIPPGAAEFPQREIMNIIAANPDLAPSNGDLGQALKAIRYLIAQAITAIPAPAEPPTYGATAEGGLAKDATGNFLLALLTNLTADGRSEPVAGDVLPLGRASDGAMVSVSAAALAAFIISVIAGDATENLFPNLVNVEGVPGVYSKIVWNNAYGTMEGFGQIDTNTGIPYYDYTLPVAFTTDAQFSVFFQDANSDNDPGPGVQITGHAVSGGVVRLFPRVASTGEVYAGTLGFHFSCQGHQ